MMGILGIISLDYCKMITRIERNEIGMKQLTSNEIEHGINNGRWKLRTIAAKKRD